MCLSFYFSLSGIAEVWGRLRFLLLRVRWHLKFLQKRKTLSLHSLRRTCSVNSLGQEIQWLRCTLTSNLLIPGLLFREGFGENNPLPVSAFESTFTSLTPFNPPSAFWRGKGPQDHAHFKEEGMWALSREINNLLQVCQLDLGLKTTHLFLQGAQEGREGGRKQKEGKMSI